jgi:hypothetical protein
MLRVHTIKTSLLPFSLRMRRNEFGGAVGSVARIEHILLMAIQTATRSTTSVYILLYALTRTNAAASDIGINL